MAAWLMQPLSTTSLSLLITVEISLRLPLRFQLLLMQLLLMVLTASLPLRLRSLRELLAHLLLQQAARLTLELTY